MALSTGSRAQLLYIPEGTFGVLPDTPAMTLVRYTGQTLELTRANMQSAEIRSDRQIADFRLGIYRVAGDIDMEMLYGDLDPFLASCLGGAWTTEDAGTPNTLIAGVTKSTFAFEVGFLDVAKFFPFSGCAVDSMSIDVKPSKITSVKMSMIGQSLGAVAGATEAASVVPASTNLPMDSFTGTILEGGSAVSIITGITLDMKNQIEPAEVIGSIDMVDYFPGRFDVTGTMTAYFADATLYNKFVNETETAISFTLKGIPTTKTFTFDMTNVKYTKASAPVTQERGIIQSFGFQCLDDLTLDVPTNITITRSNPS